MPGGARAQMTFFGNRVSDASYQPHNRDFFLFRKDVGGGEWYQIFRFDVATGDVTLLTDGKSRNSEFIWSNKGDRVAYAGTLRNNATSTFMSCHRSGGEAGAAQPPGFLGRTNYWINELGAGSD